MASTITYKGEVITNVTNDTKKLLTKQKYCEDDITITDVSSGVVPTQTKSKTYTSNQTDTIYPDAGYNLSQVDITVNVPTGGDIESRVSRTYNSNGTYQIDPSEDYDGIEGADIVVNVPAGGDIQNSKSTTYTSNGTYHILPDDDYDGVYDNTVVVNVPAGGNVEPTRTVNYTTNGTRNITPASGYDSLEGVNINVDVPNVLEYVPQESRTGVTNTPIQINNFATIDQPNNQVIVAGSLTEIGSGKGHNLPSGYQEVEYIESTGTQYINTNYNFKTNTDKIELKIKNFVRESGSHFLYGSYANPSYGLNCYGTNNDIYCYNITSGYAVSFITQYSLTNETIIEQNNNSLKINNNIINTYPVTNNTTRNIYIFCNESNEGNDYFSKYKLEYFKIWNNGNLVRYLIPCYRKSDDVIGMYDIINDIFYTNSGTGSFNKGNNVYDKNPQNPSTIIVPTISQIIGANSSVNINRDLVGIDDIKDTIEYVNTVNNVSYFKYIGRTNGAIFEGNEQTETYLSGIDTNYNKFVSNVGGTLIGNILYFDEPIPVGTEVVIYYKTTYTIEHTFQLSNWITTSSDSLNITTTDTTLQLPVNFTYYKDWRI